MDDLLSIHKKLVEENNLENGMIYLQVSRGVADQMMAKAAGVDDAWMEEDGFINEGTSNNTWIVTKDGKLVTRHLSNSILHGITRKAVVRCAELLQMEVEERHTQKKRRLTHQKLFSHPLLPLFAQLLK